MLPQCRRLVLSRTSVSRLARQLSSASAPSASDDTMADYKLKIARAALKQVPTHGWTQDAITAAVLEHPNMSISMSGMLNPSELVNWLMNSFNEELREKTEWAVFEKIQWRLQQVAPLVQTGQWHTGMAMGLSTPMTTHSQLHEFVELIAPPNSTAMYKTALGGVFVASELHLLTDSSPDYEETWKFLQLRLDELEQGQFASLCSNSIPLGATTAVATSLFEGISSLLAPPASNPVGTKASDYTRKK